MEISHYTSGLNLIFQINYTCKGHKHSLPQLSICMTKLVISLTWGKVAPNIMPLPCVLLDSWSQLHLLFLYPPPSIWEESTVTFLEICLLTHWDIYLIHSCLDSFILRPRQGTVSKLYAGHQLPSTVSSLLSSHAYEGPGADSTF